MARQSPWNEPSDRLVRAGLAIGIPIVALIAITASAIVAIAQAGSGDNGETAKWLFTAILPLFGTWVGAILAYYFAKDNLAAATESTARLTGLWDKTLTAGDKMLPLSAIVRRQVADDAAAQALPLSALLASMKDSAKHRLPIVDANERVLYLIPMSAINDFVARQQIAPADAGAIAFVNATVAALLREADLKAVVTSFEFVAPGDLLASARAKMAAKVGCKDVFVTDNGKGDGKLAGWLTDSDLATVG